MSIIVTIIFNYLEIENIARLIDVSNKLIIIAFIITLKTRNFYYLFNNRVAFLNDIVIDDNVSKYVSKTNNNNDDNNNLSILLEKEENKK